MLYAAFKPKNLFVVIDVPYQQQFLELGECNSNTEHVVALSFLIYNSIMYAGFDLATMKDFVDLFVILTYDMTGFWDGYTGQGVYLNPSNCNGGTQAIVSTKI